MKYFIVSIKQKKMIFEGSRGLLFINAKKKAESHPDLLGQIQITGEELEAVNNGAILSIALFLRENENNTSQITVNQESGNIFKCSIQVLESS
jgi:hypothetical protein